MDHLGWVDSTQYVRISRGVVQARAVPIFMLARLIVRRFPHLMAGHRVERRGLDLQGDANRSGPPGPTPMAAKKITRRPRMAPQGKSSGPPPEADVDILSNVPWRAPCLAPPPSRRTWSSAKPVSSGSSGAYRGTTATSAAAPAPKLVGPPSVRVIPAPLTPISASTTPLSNVRHSILLDVSVPRPSPPIQSNSEFSNGRVVLHFHLD